MDEPTRPQDHLTLYLQAELEEMRAAWAVMVQEHPTCPGWTWNQVAEALLNLTESPVEELVVRGALSGLMKQARFKPPELVLEELIRLVRASHDQVLQGRAHDMLEAEMP